MSEREINFEKDTLFINTKTGELGIGEIVDAEYVVEGFRGVPDQISLEVNWKFGGMVDTMDTVSGPHILKLPLRRFREVSVESNKKGKRRGWFFGKKKK